MFNHVNYVSRPALAMMEDAEKKQLITPGKVSERAWLIIIMKNGSAILLPSHCTPINI